MPQWLYKKCWQQRTMELLDAVLLAKRDYICKDKAASAQKAIQNSKPHLGCL